MSHFAANTSWRLLLALARDRWGFHDFRACRLASCGGGDAGRMAPRLGTVISRNMGVMGDVGRVLYSLLVGEGSAHALAKDLSGSRVLHMVSLIGVVLKM